jgi:DNA-binding transcriptional MerR regulator
MTDTQGEQELTIDELAGVARVPSRTIRFYQSKGILASPQIRGRVAFYGPDHIDRLRLIAQLQDRGLRIEAIRELALRIDRGELDVVEWLGLDAQLKAPWAYDLPRTVSEDELFELTGTRRPGLVGDLMRIGAIKRQGEVYLVRSPALLHVAMRLEAAGIDLETAHRADALLRRHLARAATDAVEYFFERMGNRAADGAELSRAIAALRPLGMEAVRIVFAQEMERVLRALAESGKTTKLPGHPKKTK